MSFQVGLDFQTSLLLSALILFFCFWPGYFSLRGLLKDRNLPFFVLLPFYLTFGFGSLIVLAYVIGTVQVLPSLLLALSIGFMAYSLIEKFANEKITILHELRHGFSTVNLAAMAAFVSVFLYFNEAAGILKWAMPGDLIAHGYLTSLIVYDKQVPTTFEPISNSSMYYPTGLHVFVANVVELSGIFSAEVLLVIGAISVMLIAMFVFSLTYFLTRSTLLSLLPFLSIFYINQAGDLTSYITGYFYNGPYPNLVGYLLALLMIFLTLLFKKSSFPWILSFLVSASALLFVYPSFFSIIGLICSIPFVYSVISNTKQKSWSRWEKLSILSAFVILASVFLRDSLPILLNYLPKSTLGSGFGQTAGPLSDEATQFILTFGLIVALYNLAKREMRLLYISLVEIVVVILVFVSSYFQLSYLTLVEPQRLLPLIWVVSFLIIASFVQTIIQRISLAEINLVKKTGKFTGMEFQTKAIAIILFIIVLLPSFANAAQFGIANRMGYYGQSSAFEQDYNVSQWICKNIPSGSIILNDESWSGWFLPSYCFQLVIYHYFPHPDKFADANLIWAQEQNATLVKAILLELHIQYIFVTGDSYYLNDWLYGGGGSYLQKTYSPLQSIQIFDSYPFLQKLYQYHSSAVYVVKMD